jgi:hypothetical protein
MRLIVGAIALLIASPQRSNHLSPFVHPADTRRR